ncbi:ATP-binding protein [Streptomyces kasugaensis]|uniref:ATP-binding protein n=1 Tax=Streptomyces kasugaensis TaxID=1946 RepID=A0A4Q9I0Y2_STRKA|nr:ATP-binding protein [Streptomyces kasugaensis]
MSQAPHPRNRLTLADTPNAVGLARLHTADVLSCWGVPSEIVETAQLLVSELATNAVRHPKEGEEQASQFSSRNTVQTFEISLEIAGDAVRVSVWDRDRRPPVLKEVGVEATGGRGVFIVAMMSRNWGHYPAWGMPGKVVWAEVGLVPASRVGESERATGSPGRPRAAGPEVPRAARVDLNVLGRVLVGVRALSLGREKGSQLGGSEGCEEAVPLGAAPIRRGADGERRRAGKDRRDVPPPPGRGHPRPVAG